MGYAFYDNIISYQDSSMPYGVALVIDEQSSGVVVDQNIIFFFQCEFTIIDEGTGSTTTPNDIDLAGTNNNPGGTAPSEPFPDPYRDAASYYGSIGGSPATLDGFIAAARTQSKDNGIRC